MNTMHYTGYSVYLQSAMKCVRKAKKWPLFPLLVSIAPKSMDYFYMNKKRSTAISVGIPKYSSVL